MTIKNAPMQLWVHLGVTLSRNLLQLPESPELFEHLRQQMQQARLSGVDAVVLPISWRHVAPFAPEQASQASSWRPYCQLFTMARQLGLKVIPDLSLVARGMDDSRHMTLLPGWLWGHLQQQLPADEPRDTFSFLDQYGRDSVAVTSYWAHDYTRPLFAQFLQGFAEHLAEFADMVPHLVLSVGPEGEWRYPLLGHYASDGLLAHFPCFSQRALSQLRDTQLAYYGSLAAWQQAWHCEKQDLTANQVLKAQLIQIASALLEGTHGQAEQDVYRWYQASLTAYGQQLMLLAAEVFVGRWQGVSLGVRLPGRLPLLKGGDEHSAALIAGFATVAVDAAPGADDEHYQQLLAQLIPAAVRSRCRLLLTGAGVQQGEREPMLMTHWQSAAAALGLPLLAESDRRLALDDHPQWDHLINTVMHQGAYCGWAIRDLDILMGQEVGEARLRQLTRLRHGQGQVSRLNHREFRVMGPLHLKVANQRQLLSEAEWQQFADEVRQLRRMGVTAISTDLWWGLIEGRQSGVFDWSYYDRLVALLARHDMRWVPILSFHQAGGNVNDDFMQTIPLWLWGKLLETHPELDSVRDLQYVSETGDASMEYVSLWADQYVQPYYERFMTAFRDHFISRAGMIAEINVSLGPAGELRYPSYNAHDWGNYPNRGTLQCYSPLAEQDWQRYLRSRFSSLEALNYAFGTRYRTFAEIAMPVADNLFDNKEYVYSAWAREFLGWYHGALVAHGQRILQAALDIFAVGDWVRIPVGIKVPGIHWEISDPASPRVAEITAGLIRPHPTLGPTNQREYLQLLEQLVPSDCRQRVVVHFTCLEMINKDYEGYSRAADLVGWFADAAHELGISLMGENALAGELYGEQGWQQIANALRRTPGFGGITFLRMQNFFDENRTPRERLQWLINQFQ
ncbi:family 14 glycosylhydrolase [Pseudaeromonas sharmana]|uniref:Beta-amylase n=1 Tax=Pseudaeromonas sharmana TaxID=328412 RepID=A0ABV8CPG1_9GAMM